MTAPARWVTGVAEIVAVKAKIFVACPHCGRTHEHGRGVLGSASIVAGGHTGFTWLREYRPVDLGRRGKR
ncbi:hypothetical protein ACQI4L_09205 [Mycolicibacterium litorale]|uniref:hypothetical protein n=1 Tax=Mycolicibacterium litorale TaxID=758802 RepID=UPI003CE6C07D